MINVILCIVLAVPFIAIFGTVFYKVFIKNEVLDGDMEDFVGAEPELSEFGEITIEETADGEEGV
jgi:hypothetical protein